MKTINWTERPAWDQDERAGVEGCGGVGGESIVCSV